MSLFPLGRVVATPAALSTLESLKVNPASLIDRHHSGDWGDLPAEDAAMNNAGTDGSDRLLSAYLLSGGVKVWIITERDRSSTTVLLPAEY